MKKKFLSIMLLTIVLVGCSNHTTDVSNKKVEQDKEMEETVNDVFDEIVVAEELEKSPDVNVDFLVTEVDEADLNLKAYEYSFEDRKVEKEGEPIFYLDNFEDKSETFHLSEQVNLYGYNGICLGYTKEDIAIITIGQYKDWYHINLGGKTRFVKVEDVEMAVASDDPASETDLASDTQTSSNTSQNDTDGESSALVVAEPVDEFEEAPKQDAGAEAPAPVQSNKYTPEEAIAVYRSAMEAGGMTWDPSIKDVTSWGTGWIYLEKGQPEWCAATNLESAAIGGHGGKSWTKYYLEVTGSDENAVYVTEWTSN